MTTRTLLICQHDEPISREGVARWLAHTTMLVGIIIVTDPGKRRYRRVLREWRRSGSFGLLDVAAFRLYYRLACAKRDRRWQAAALARLARAYPQLGDVPVINVESPNSAQARAFIAAHPCDIMIARCKTLLKDDIFSLPARATLVMHPGICPEYRNAHGCFWALAQRDLTRVGMTLLAVDRGIDTGPVYAYFRSDIDEVAESHAVIQDRMVLDNLPAIAERIDDIARGDAHPLETQGRRSRVWGQPRLSHYRRWKREARACAGTGGAALLYHDLTGAGVSGFDGADAEIYKVARATFRDHLAALAQAFPVGPALLTRNRAPLVHTRFLLTFDDGGASMMAVAELLEARGWYGHFLITTGRLGTRGFVTADNVRELHARGHAIGSHSVSHPPIFSALPYDALLAEWRDSLACLADIVGNTVDLASVPGGYVSRNVIDTAARAGVRTLFTSEPHRRVEWVGAMQVIGRFNIKRHLSPEMAVALARSRSAQTWQWLRWNGLKLVKRGLGPVYPVARKTLLRAAQEATAR